MDIVPCEVCDSPINRGKRCRQCAAIHDALSADSRSDVTAITAAMRNSLRDGLFWCYYTGLPLVLDDSGSPYYRSIDHRTPGDRRDLVLCCLFVNEMKGDLDEAEFRSAIRALAACFETGQPLNLGEVRFQYRKRNWLGNRRSCGPTLKGISGPIVQEFVRSGMTDDELGGLLEEAKLAMRAEHRDGAG